MGAGIIVHLLQHYRCWLGDVHSVRLVALHELRDAKVRDVFTEGAAFHGTLVVAKDLLCACASMCVCLVLIRYILICPLPQCAHNLGVFF